MAQTFIGRAPAYLRCLALCRRVGGLPLDVLILGESGSGKEHLARLVHASSGRAGPWVALNCAGLTSELADAELFGYERGAFTGAREGRGGLVAAAEGGTLFLDEVGDLDLRVQAKLLRFLEERRYRAVGAGRERVSDVRIVAATCRDLRAMVSRGEFRGDLLHRLSGYVLQVPSLRERPGDAARLARHFLRTDPICRAFPARLSREAAAMLNAAPWPGNVRELRRILRALLVEETPRVISASAVARVLGMPETQSPPERRAPRTLIQAQLRHGSLGPGALAAGTGLSRSTVQRTLRALLSEGKIVLSEDGRKHRYHLAAETLEGQALLPEPLRRAHLTLSHAGRLGASQLAGALGVSTRTASRWLALLVEAGLAAPVGESKRTRRYVCLADRRADAPMAAEVKAQGQAHPV